MFSELWCTPKVQFTSIGTLELFPKLSFIVVVYKLKFTHSKVKDEMAGLQVI